MSDIPNREIVIEVPATCANLGPGFDTFGLAVNIYNKYTCTLLFEEDEEYKEAKSGKFPVIWEMDENLRQYIKTDRSNLLLNALIQILAEKEKKLPVMKIEIEANVPLSRGLGSSANAIVAGLFMGREILRKIHKELISISELQYLASKLEGHPDNVTPAIFGGFCFCYGNNLDEYICRNIKDAPELLLVIPKYSLNTERARSIMPESITRNDAILNMRCAAMWIEYLHTGKLSILENALNDRIHQPYRQKLIPEFEPIKSIVHRSKGIGTVISGAGPSILIFLNNTRDNTPIIEELQDYETNSPNEFKILSPKVDNIGARLIKSF